MSKETAQSWAIELEFLKPLINSSQSLTDIYIRQTNEYLFYCHKEKKDLRGTKALEYIRWGESEGIHNVISVRSHRPYWYSLHGVPFDFLLMRFWDKRFWTPVAKSVMICSDNFFYGKSKSTNKNPLAALLNSTFHFLQIEIVGRTNQGLGVLNTYGPDFRHLRFIDSLSIDHAALKKAFEMLAKRPVMNIFEEVDQQDRKDMDNIIFDALKLTQGERDAVYEAVIQLVSQRLNKAKSL